MLSTEGRGRRLRAGVSLIALAGLVLQPSLADAQGRGGDPALNACAAERAPLVQLDKDYEQLKRSKMGAAVGEGIKRGAAVIASGVMSGNIGIPGSRGGGFGGGLGGFGGVVGSIGGIAAQSAARQQAGNTGAAPPPSSMFGPDLLTGALSLNVPGIAGGGDNVKAYAALAVLVAIVGSIEAYAQLKEQEAGGDLRKASFNIDQDAGRQVTVSRQMADSARALADCRSRQLGDLNTRLASASNDKDRRELRRERTQLIGALKQDIDVTGDVLTEQTVMAKTFTQGRAMTDGVSEAEVLGGQAPAYADAPSTARLAMPAKKVQASTGPASVAAAPAAPAPDLVTLRATMVRSAPVASAETMMNLPAGRAVKPKTAQAEGGWWEIDVAGAPGYIRAADLGPSGSAPAAPPTQTAGRSGPGGRGRAGAAAAPAPPPPAAPAVAGPSNIRAHNQMVIAARDNGKNRLSSLMTDIQTSQRRESILWAALERLGLA
jgi:hypothetical protein